MTKIIVTNKNVKKNLLKKEQQEFHSYKIYTKQEFFEKINEQYHELSSYEIVKKTNVHPKIAKIYLRYLPYLEVNKDYQEEKLEKLKEIKKDLLQKGYISKDLLFIKYLEGKTILLKQISLTKEEELLLKKIPCTVQKEEDLLSTSSLRITKCQTIDDEVLHVFTKITDLILQKVPLKNIKLVLPSSDYDPIIQRFSTYFHIPIEEKESPILIFPIVKTFLNLLNQKSLEESLSDIQNQIQTQEEEKIYQELVSICLPYFEENLDFEVVKKMIQIEIEEKKIRLYRYRNVLQTISFEDGWTDEDYVFLLGLNQNEVPKIQKDDDYLSDREKEKIQIETSKEKNERQKKEIIERLKQENLFLSYKRFAGKEFNRASFLEECEVIEEEMTYDYSNELYNSYLLAVDFDFLNKYGEEKEDLAYLYTHAKNNYQTYHNEYQTISKDKLYAYLQNKILLSYSTLDLFFKCPFRFYLSKILKITEKKETANLDVGNFVHNVLYSFFSTKKDLDLILQEEMKKIVQDKTLGEKEKFYQQKYFTEVKKLISFIQKGERQTDFQNTYLEKNFQVEFPRKIKVTLYGKIDKVMTLEKKEKLYAMIIDYKTGTIHADFNPMFYGLNMQLFIYDYLLKKNIPNLEFAGVYFQNIMKNVLNHEDGKTYEQLEEEAYQFQGYTRKDLSLLSSIEKDLDHPHIRGLRVKQDGSFSSLAKVLDENEIEALRSITEEKIKEGIQAIEKADFAIAPIRIGNETEKEMTGCAFCPYQDICYKKAKDIRTVKKMQKLEFLKEGD